MEQGTRLSSCTHPHPTPFFRGTLKDLTPQSDQEREGLYQEDSRPKGRQLRPSVVDPSCDTDLGEENFWECGIPHPGGPHTRTPKETVVPSPVGTPILRVVGVTLLW